MTGTSTVRLRAMATDVTLSVAGDGRDVTLALDRAGQVFRRVEAACTRFDPAGPLAAVNAAPQRWHAVPPELFDAVGEAWQAHRETEGLFDPRVLETLLRLGYDRTLPFRRGPVTIGTAAVDGRDGAFRPEQVPVRNAVRPAAPGPWHPELDPQRRAVRLGEHPIDLGGIGKGLAVRWAARELAGTGAPYLVEAGGDCCLGGDGPDGDGWRVGVEDPDQAGERPDLLAVLELRTTSCATSSIRVRNWQVDGRPVHHLIDPRTADSARSGLRSVTVVDPDPARAEVWSKALFLTGRDGIAQACAGRGLAALWVDDDGRLGTSEPVRPLLIWEVERVG
jgi:thiamine biosynthesis lipoprotein